MAVEDSELEVDAAGEDRYRDIKLGYLNAPVVVEVREVCI
jgi:hypothetical protein